MTPAGSTPLVDVLMLVIACAAFGISLAALIVSMFGRNR